MKKVLFILDEIDASGVSKALLNYIKLHNRKILSISILLFNKNGMWEKKVPDDVMMYHLFKKSPERTSKISRIIFNLILTFFPKLIILNKIKLNEYNTIIDYKGQYPGLLKLSSSKKITWIHGDLSLSSNPIEFQQYMKNGKKISYKYKQKNRKRGFKHSNIIICVSSTMRNNFINRYGFAEKTVFVQNIFDFDNLTRHSLEKIEMPHLEGIVFCCVSRVSAGKGIERLLNVMLKLNELDYNSTLLIVGGGDTISDMVELKNHLGLINVYFMGHVENPSAILSKSDVFVCPSFTEAFSSTTYEAYLLNKAIISTDVGSVKEFIIDGINGKIVDNTFNGLLIGMKDYLDNPFLIQKFENILKSNNNKYDMYQNALQIDDLIIN